MIPPVTSIDQKDTARLIPSKYSMEEASVLTRIAEDDGHLQTIFALDQIANDRLRGQADLLPGIAAHELVADVPYASIINAAFCHASPTGARFNGPDRGAWYAGFAVETSLAEVSFHHALWLQEIDHFYDSVTYDAYLADFNGTFHDLRDQHAYAPCLDPDDYRPAQSLSEKLHAIDAAGIVYPSVRTTGDCIACFHPRLVTNVRKGACYRLTWSGQAMPQITLEA